MSLDDYNSKRQDKQSYRYRLGFNQSLSTGVVAFEGNVQFDDKNKSLDHSFLLRTMLREAENTFRHEGYRVASDIVPKVKPQKIEEVTA